MNFLIVAIRFTLVFFHSSATVLRCNDQSSESLKERHKVRVREGERERERARQLHKCCNLKSRPLKNEEFYDNKHVHSNKQT